VPYKLPIKKITNGFLNKSSNIMVLPRGQKKGTGAIAYMLKHIMRLQAVVKILTSKTRKTLNLLAK
jgi:hypothetical protein